jgi:hypothetical protein
MFKKNEYIIGGGPGKHKNIYSKIPSQESLGWQSFVQAG